jgi:hypothetical protein
MAVVMLRSILEVSALAQLRCVCTLLVTTTAFNMSHLCDVVLS